MSKKVLFPIIGLILIFTSVIFLNYQRIQQYFIKRPSALVTPIATNSNSKFLGVNQWFPQNGGQVLGLEIGLPEITAKAALFVDTKTGEVLYSKNIHQQLPIASLTKTMTVLVSLENHNLTDKFVVSQSAADMEPDKMSLIAGERLTLSDLLYGIFLLSANDAAETLAQGIPGGRSKFISLMNEQALQIGMKNTHYVNPTGLDEDSGNTYSSAYDLVLLTRYIIRNFPEVVQYSSTEHMELPATADHQDYNMYSGISLLTTYPGVVGFKIGYTPEAGLTMITLARKEGHEVVGVLLGSEDRRDETRELLDFSFRKLGVPTS